MRPTPLRHVYAGPARDTMNVLGWSYPAEIDGFAAEHRAVRTAAGLFDFAFMAHFAVTGRGALDDLQRVVTNDVARLS